MGKLTDHTDEQLVQLLKQRPDAAFTEIYDRYWDKLFVVACHRLDNEAEAKELVQNVFYNLWKRRDALQLKYSLSTYLSTAIKYEVLNTLASRNRKERYETFQQQHLQVASNDTQNQVDFNELQDKVAVLVKKLPEKCRIVFELRQQGFSQKEIASSLNIAEKTVEAHVANAMRHLRTGLNDATIPLCLFFLS